MIDAVKPRTLRYLWDWAAKPDDGHPADASNGTATEDACPICGQPLQHIRINMLGQARNRHEWRCPDGHTFDHADVTKPWRKEGPWD